MDGTGGEIRFTNHEDGLIWMVFTSVEHRDGPVKLHSKTTFPLHNWWTEGLQMLKDYNSHM